MSSKSYTLLAPRRRSGSDEVSLQLSNIDIDYLSSFVLPNPVSSPSRCVELMDTHVGHGATYVWVTWVVRPIDPRVGRSVELIDSLG